MLNRLIKTRIMGYILGTFCLSVLLTLFSCTKSPNEPEEIRPQIEVTEDITEDTVWESGKDYIVRGNVVVEESAMLTVQKDVNVFFTLDVEELEENSILYVEGGIHVEGDSKEMIEFKVKEINADKKMGVGLILNQSSKFSILKHCKMSHMIYGIKVVESKAALENCTIEYCQIGIVISKSDSFLLKDSEVLNNSVGISIELSQGQSDSAICIKDNYFYNNLSCCIDIQSKSIVQMINNSFLSGDTGINFEYQNDCYITHNLFESLALAISTKYTTGKIVRNNIVNCERGLFIGRTTQLIDINYNNLLFCDIYKIKLDIGRTEFVINAENNWWGTTDDAAINQFIMDATDENMNERAGIVDYIPIEQAYIENSGLLN